MTFALTGESTPEDSGTRVKTFHEREYWGFRGETALVCWRNGSLGRPPASNRGRRWWEEMRTRLSVDRGMAVLARIFSAHSSGLY